MPQNPANLVLSHSPFCTDDQCDIECAIKALDEQSGTLKSGDHKSTYFQKPSANRAMSGANQGRFQKDRPGDSGGASRFFFQSHFTAEEASRFLYCAKPSRAERNRGCEGLPERVRNVTQGHGRGAVNTIKGDGTGIRENRPTANIHPTVKPLKLMRYLIGLITPPGGTVLDPFAGSGTTLVAAKELGFPFIGIEKEVDYHEIAMKRVEAVCPA